MARRRGDPRPSVVESTGKKSCAGSVLMSVPETDTGGRGEQPQVNELDVVKELGILIP